MVGIAVGDAVAVGVRVGNEVGDTVASLAVIEVGRGVRVLIAIGPLVAVRVAIPTVWDVGVEVGASVGECRVAVATMGAVEGIAATVMLVGSGVGVKRGGVDVAFTTAVDVGIGSACLTTRAAAADRTGLVSVTSSTTIVAPGLSGEGEAISVEGTEGTSIVGSTVAVAACNCLTSMDASAVDDGIVSGTGGVTVEDLLAGVVSGVVSIEGPLSSMDARGDSHASVAAMQSASIAIHWTTKKLAHRQLRICT